MFSSPISEIANFLTDLYQYSSMNVSLSATFMTKSMVSHLSSALQSSKRDTILNQNNPLHGKSSPKWLLPVVKGSGFQLTKSKSYVDGMPINKTKSKYS